ncbi:MAG: hypothetical protein B7X76_10750 [Azorhizobium sp. 39-67-5]|nr:MAG: hypothetical protein B7X76_10750 [Azorhizobium sp. 39-67-5]
MRLLNRLPLFLRKVRGDAGDEVDEMEPLVAKASPKVLREAGNELNGTINTFLKQRLQMPGQPEDLDRVLQLWNANQVLKSLQDCLANLAQGLDGMKGTAAATFCGTLAEAAHAMTRAVADEVANFDDMSPSVLSAITADRSALMKKLRDDLWQRAPDLTALERQAVWNSADMFEQMVWLLNRYAMSLAK